MRFFTLLACCFWPYNAFVPGFVPSHASGRHLKKKGPPVLKQQKYDDSMPPSQNGEDSSDYDSMLPSQHGEQSYMPPPYSNGDPSYVPPYANGDPSFMPPPPPPYPNDDFPEYMPKQPPYAGGDPAYYTPSEPNDEPSMPPLPDDDYSFQDDIQKQFQGFGGTSSSSSRNQSAQRIDTAPLKRDISKVPRAGDRPYGSAFSFRGDTDEGTSPPRYPLGYQGERRAPGTDDGLTQRGFPMQEPFSFRSQQQDSGRSLRPPPPRPPPSFNRLSSNDAGGFKQDISKIPRAGDRPYGSAHIFRGDDSGENNLPRDQPMFQGSNWSTNSSRLKHDISQFRGPNPRADGTPSTFREYASPFSFREGNDDSYQTPSESSRKRAVPNSKGLKHDNSEMPRASDSPYGSGFSVRGDRGTASPKYQPDRRPSSGQKFMADSSALKQDVPKAPRAGDRPYGSSYPYQGDSGGTSSSVYNPGNQSGKRIIDSSGLKHDVSKFGSRDDNPYEESYSFGQDRNMKW